MFKICWIIFMVLGQILFWLGFTVYLGANHLSLLIMFRWGYKTFRSCFYENNFV